MIPRLKGKVKYVLQVPEAGHWILGSPVAPRRRTEELAQKALGSAFDGHRSVSR